MAQNSGPKKKSLFSRLRTPFRLIILNNETLEEKTSFNLSLLNLYLLVCALCILSAAIALSLLVFSPLRTLVPGYADYTETREFIEMNRKVTAMSEELEAQMLYTESLSRILKGELETEDDILQNTRQSEPNGNGLSEDAVIPERIPEDDLLRREVDMREVLNVSNVQPATDLYNLQFIPPLTGLISMSFDPTIEHYGIDVIAPKDSPVKAIMDGVVFMNDWTLQTGNSLGIIHEGNIVSFYKHNAYVFKNAGDRVRAGDAIAIIGNTGKQTDGPHLHFELWIDGQPVNPEEYINFE
nr:M23 family metallopeptidase [Saprospiraceae bacterium]